MLLPLFKQSTSHLLSILLASLLFGCLHYRAGFSMIFLAGIAGIFYGIVYTKTNHVFYSALAHFLLNLTHFVFFLTRA